MGRQTRRRPSSAGPTSRPRRVAGLTPPTARGPEPESAAESESPEPAAVTLEKRRTVPAAEPGSLPESVPSGEPGPNAESGPSGEPASDPEPDPAEATAPTVGVVGSPRTTRVLLATILVLALAAIGGGIFLRVHDGGGSASGIDPGSPVSADAERPVRITGEDAQVAVAAAAQAAYTIVATSYQDYDAQVEEAAALMTPTFAEQYRQTANDVADAVVSSKTEVQVSVVAQGVVRADREQVQALVFLNQFVTRNGRRPVFTPYRALVTVVNTDQGWLVSDLQTK
jgi:Mce-associated membrane protein